MASARVPGECFKCKDAVGSFNCAGCKNIFCLKHSIEHRQDLCTRFEELMTGHNITLQQMQDKERENALLKKNLYSQIDEWKNAIIERVCQRVEELRQQLGILMDIKNGMMIKDIRSLTDEIHQRHEKEDFFEHDIERIQNNIKKAQQAIEKSIQQTEIELRIEPNETVDWENLIYIQEKLNSANSSVTNKDENGTRNSMNSNREQDLHKPIHSYLPSAPVVNASQKINSQFIQVIRYTGEQNSAVNFRSSAHLPSYQTPSNTHRSPNSPNSIEKRQKKPLTIVDPVSQESIEARASVAFADSIQISSQAAPVNPTPRPSSSNSSSVIVTNRVQINFRQQSAELFSDNSDT